MASKAVVSGWISEKWNAVTSPDQPSKVSILGRFLDLVLGFWVTALKITGVCPLYLPADDSPGCGISAFVAYFWVFMFTSLKSLHLFAITIPLFANSLTGSLDIFIEMLCSKQGELLAFISGILIAIEWRNITTSIARIRRYEAAYFNRSEPRLVALLLLSVAVTVSVRFNQTILAWMSSSAYHVGTEIAFCANFYGIEELRSVPFLTHLLVAFHVMNDVSMDSIVMLCATVAIVTGRLCFRMKSNLRSQDDDTTSNRIIQDLLDLRNLINKLSREIGALLLLFYIQSVLWIVFLINNVANINRSQSVWTLVRSVSVVAVVTAVVTFAMIYAHDQADISQALQERAVQETNPKKRNNLIGYLHLVFYSPAGFSLAGIIMVDRGFIGAMVSVLFTYGTFVLQLRESRSEPAASSSHHLTTLCNKTITC